VFKVPGAEKEKEPLLDTEEGGPVIDKKKVVDSDENMYSPSTAPDEKEGVVDSVNS